MHELSVTRSIFLIVQRHAIKYKASKVLSVKLEIGALSDLEKEWLQRYFDYLSEGSIAEGAKLIIRRVPSDFKCNQCKHSFEVMSLQNVELFCPNCRSEEVVLISGNTFIVKDMEVQ